MNLSADTNLLDPDLMVVAKGPPHNLFAAWRETDPVHWNAPKKSYKSGRSYLQLDHGFWVLTRYEDVFNASRTPHIFSSHLGGPIIWDTKGTELERTRAGIMGMDPPVHTQFKRLVMPPFSPKALSAFQVEIGEMATSIVDSVANKGSCEFVFDVASRLPVYTFCVLMGIPVEDHEKIFRLGNRIADTENPRAEGDDAQLKLFAYAQELAERKRQAPDSSMMSAYVNGEVDGERISAEQINMFFVTLAIAGHETTRGTAAHFIRLMNEHPDQYALVKSDPDKYLLNAIHEVLRHSPPVIQFRRTATQDTMIGDRPIQLGDKVYLSYAAANRDPAIFDNPDEFDITRSNASKHLSFGTGPHVCLGANLALLQLQILLKQIITRIPDIHPVGEPEYLRSIWFNAIMKMQVEFQPEGFHTSR